MRTRRRQSSNSGNAGQLPGSRAWRESIERIKGDLTRDGGWLLRKLEEQDAEMVVDRQTLADQAASLRIEELLAYMNDNLLDGEGVVETTFRWHLPEVDDLDDWDEDDDDEDDEVEYEDIEDEDGDEDEEVAFPAVSVTLSWKQAGRLQVNVELAQIDDDLVLSINGEELDSPTTRFLQSGLVDAFTEQMSFFEEADEEEEE